MMIIGIDSLDPFLLQEFSGFLPNFKKLIEESPTFKTKSVFPPDTIPAWVTIYTGLNPAMHGVIHTFDLFESDWRNIVNLNTNSFKGKTFWDIVGTHGKRVCILFPQCAFPPWEVNGIMVSRTLYPIEELKKKGINVENGGVLMYPNSIYENCQTCHLGTIPGNYPGFNKLGEYADAARKKVLDQADFALMSFNNYPWDMFFVYFSELDIIQHFFWRYHDKNDPTHPIDNPYKNIIKEFYILFDEIIGRFLSIDHDIVKIVMSDHGHKMRPPKNVNINEYLRNKGFLKSNKKSYIIEKIKKQILDLAHKNNLTHWLTKIGTNKLLLGTSKKIYTSSSMIDFENSLAYLSYFTGAKSYSEGGIHINRDIKEYDKFRDDLIDDLLDLQDPNNNRKVFEWIKKREDLYNGKNLHLYPDIIFKLNDEYGAYWGIYTHIIGTSYEHNLSSGGHREDAILLISNCKREVAKKDINLSDIAPTILDFYEINCNTFDFDGKSIFSINL